MTALEFVTDNLEEVTNAIGGVIGYRLHLSAEETAALTRLMEAEKISRAEVRKLKAHEARNCGWIQDHDGGMFETGCKHALEFTLNGIKENEFVFCPFCGGKIIEETKE